MVVDETIKKVKCQKAEGSHRTEMGFHLVMKSDGEKNNNIFIFTNL